MVVSAFRFGPDVESELVSSFNYFFNIICICFPIEITATKGYILWVSIYFYKIPIVIGNFQE